MFLQTKQLTKRYLRGSREFPAVNAVDFGMEKGDFYMIVGKSGSGKSTFLNMIAGLTEPSSGEIYFLGEEIWKQKDAVRSRIRNRKIGFVPQGMSALPTLTVLENILFSYYLYEKEGDPEGRAMFFLEKLGMKHLVHEYPKNLSGGEMRRMVLVRALINQPKLLIVDEPTADLDRETTEMVMNLFRDLKKEGMAILMVTHEMDVLSYADKVYVMSDGEMADEDGK